MRNGLKGEASGALYRSPWRSSAFILAALTLFYAAGCASAGRDFPTDPVNDIRIGETSRSEIRQMFGAPWRVGIEDGQSTWTYGRYRYRLFGETSTTDLVVRFNDAGKVASYSFNTTERRDFGQ